VGYLTETPQSSVVQEVVVVFWYPSLVSSCMTGIALLCRVARQTYGHICVVRPKTVQDTVVGELNTIMNDVYIL